MKYYPINVDITDKRCVVLGGGGVAERKVESLLRCMGRVTVISPDLTPRLKELLSHSKIQHICREYKRGDFEDAFLVFVATNDSRVNAEASQEALGKGILVNTVDKPKRCNFIVPSVVDRDDLVITVSTSGKSPALAKKIREDLEASYGEEYSIFLTIMGAVRERLLKTSNNSEKNRTIFYRLVDSNMLVLIKEGKREQINNILAEILGEGYSLDELKIGISGL
ncbi:MAG: bifunctional precorrin-2 dehydrogenase/sirohydrochlorin ferrochelatase [Thermodesulfobacteriota bacterium]